MDKGQIKKKHRVIIYNFVNIYKVKYKNNPFCSPAMDNISIIVTDESYRLINNFGNYKAFAI
jgi:hypothetical protein